METSGASGRALSNVSLGERAYRIRRNALRMGEVQGQGYIAQALGIADVLAVAYFHALRYRPDDPHWAGRDRFLLSIGHYAIALYAALIEAGIVPEEWLLTYGGDDSHLPMSGMAAYTPGMEITGGSLGHRARHRCRHVPRPEAQVVRCLRLQPHVRRRARRRADLGGRDVGGPLEARQPDLPRRRQQPAGRRWARWHPDSEPLVPKWEAFGWHAQRVDGNDIEALVQAFDRARTLDAQKPRVIICDTRMAKGVPFLEARERSHFLRVEEREWAQALDALEAGRQAS